MDERQAPAEAPAGSPLLSSASPCVAPSDEAVSAWLPFCSALPKGELHAHLNGSVRDSTITELSEALGETNGGHHRSDGRTGSLAEAFAKFGHIHRLVTTPALVARVAREAVEDFAAENCIYLELRTGPKVTARRSGRARPSLSGLGEHGLTLLAQAIPATGMTKRSYAEAVLDGIDAAACGPGGGDGSGPITVRLLLSIDRRETAAEAAETVALAIALRSRGVVGVDLSGNPELGHFSDWMPALEAARAAGLALTLHCGEFGNPDEARAMLAFQPARLGHAVTATTDAAVVPLLLASRIPVELCLTSNVLSRAAPSFGEHHFRILAAAGHPLVLCTDDSGVFGTTLSREYALAAATFGLGEAQLWQLARAGVAHAFLPAPVRDALLARVEAARGDVKL